MGGEVRARSTLGAGSAFTVTLPRADAWSLRRLEQRCIELL